MKDQKVDWSGAFDTVEGGLAIIDTEHNILRANKPFAKMVGISMEELIGRKCYEVIHGRDTPPPSCPLEKTLKTKKTASAKVKEPHLGKGTFLLMTSPVLDDEKEVKWVVHTINEITERKPTEEFLRRSVEELEAVCEIDKNIIEMPDLSSLIMFIVRKARELTGADAAFYGFVEGDAICHDTFSGIRTRAFKNIRLRKGTGLGWFAVEENKPVVVEDFFSDERFKDPLYDIVRKEGLVSFLAVPFMSGKGEPIGVLYVANRRKTRFTKEQVRALVTLAGQTSGAVDHSRRHEKTSEAYEKLKSLDELKSNLIADVIHELRTPLAITDELRTPLVVAKGALELARGEEDKERRNGLLKMAVDAIVHHNLIVGDLIEAAYMEQGKRKLEDVNLADVITHVSSEFKPMLIKDELKMETNVQENLPMARANHKQLMHVLRNLISNAIKFNKRGGKILIEARQKGEFAEVSVADTGIGIPKDDLPKVFDRFYQVDASTSRASGSAGMGLAVVKEIVEAHGGKIGVESEPKGTRFCFTLPIAGGG